MASDAFALAASLFQHGHLPSPQTIRCDDESRVFAEVPGQPSHVRRFTGSRIDGIAGRMFTLTRTATYERDVAAALTDPHTKPGDLFRMHRPIPGAPSPVPAMVAHTVSDYLLVSCIARPAATLVAWYACQPEKCGRIDAGRQACVTMAREAPDGTLADTQLSIGERLSMAFQLIYATACLERFGGVHLGTCDATNVGWSQEPNEYMRFVIPASDDGRRPGRVFRIRTYGRSWFWCNLDTAIVGEHDHATVGDNVTRYREVHSAGFRSETKLGREPILGRSIDARSRATELHASDLRVPTAPRESWRLCAIDLVWGMLRLADPRAGPGTPLYSWWQNLELASDLMDVLRNADWATTQGSVLEDESRWPIRQMELVPPFEEKRDMVWRGDRRAALFKPEVLVGVVPTDRMDHRDPIEAEGFFGVLEALEPGLRTNAYLPPADEDYRTRILVPRTLALSALVETTADDGGDEFVKFFPHLRAAADRPDLRAIVKGTDPIDAGVITDSIRHVASHAHDTAYLANIDTENNNDRIKDALVRIYSAGALSLLPRYDSETILRKRALYTIAKGGGVTVSYTRRVCLPASRPTARDFMTILGHAPIGVPCIVANKANIESLAQTRLNERQLGVYAGVDHALYPFPVGSVEDREFLSNHESMYQNPGIHARFWPILIREHATHQRVNDLCSLDPDGTPLRLRIKFAETSPHRASTRSSTTSIAIIDELAAINGFTPAQIRAAILAGEAHLLRPLTDLEMYSSDERAMPYAWTAGSNRSRQQIWLEDERGLLRCGTDRPWLPIAIDVSPDRTEHGGAESGRGDGGAAGERLDIPGRRARRRGRAVAVLLHAEQAQRGITQRRRRLGLHRRAERGGQARLRHVSS
jgi:hypothetical protein